MFLNPSGIKTTSRNQTDQKTKPKQNPQTTRNTLKYNGHDPLEIYIHDDLSVHKPKCHGLTLV